MADITAIFANLSSLESSNAPAGATAVATNLDDNLRIQSAHLAGARDACGWFGLRLSSVSGTNTVVGSVAAQGSITMAPTAYATGMRFHVIPENTNTGAAFLNASSLGNKSIFLNGAALVGYEMRKSCPVVLEYDGTQLNIIGGAHGGDGIPLGTVLPHAGTTAPNGFLFCFGQAVSRTTYADLFGLLSTTYGTGDGSTTFNLPDLRGRVVAGQDDMGGSSANRLTNQSGGLDGDTLGATGGAETHALTVAQMPAHAHPGSTVVDGFAGGGAPDKVSIGQLANQGTFPVDVASQGGDGAHNNVQPTIVLNYIIKT
jgi:microcystin-dependent protein